MPKTHIVRDPVHSLISFNENDPFEALAWSLVSTKEFQRLRRIKQLGFSDLVYPGATHTRFSHCIGVFHTARNLVRCLEIDVPGVPENDRAKVAQCAALLHDIGHGPFSHTFESVMKKVGKAKDHKSWTIDIIRGNTEVSEVLRNYDKTHGKDLQIQVAELFEQEYPADLYSTIVSSQFDADRLDYLRRDRLMTGIEQGVFDWEWLLKNLETGIMPVPGGGEEGEFAKSPCLVLGYKGLTAAEGYLLGRFHLYKQVYLHKTTRSAEKMLGALLLRVADLIQGGHVQQTGLESSHPIVRFFSEDGGTLERYLALDDAVLWGGLLAMENSADEIVKELAHRLRHRKLYKCLDIGAMELNAREDAQVRFQQLLKSRRFHEIDVLQDRFPVSVYKFRDYESQGALEKVIIHLPDGRYADLANVSPVVNALSEEEIYRVYARNEAVMRVLTDMWTEASS